MSNKRKIVNAENKVTMQNDFQAGVELLKKAEHFSPVLSSDRNYFSTAYESFADIIGRE